ncbi:MAG: heme-binding protein [Bacteroidia bacterium]|nr:heme-binding protein [Bacteroidia bacterium]
MHRTARLLRASACLPGLCAGAILFLTACQTPAPPAEPPLVVRDNPAGAADRAAEILRNTPVQLAEGLTIQLWASDSLAPDPIAMSIDNEGRVFLTRTNRQKNSEFDIRGHQDWIEASIALQTPEDRRAFLQKTFAPERSAENEWLKDLNGDGSHDWRDLAVEKEEIWRLEDSTGDGYADKATRILHDFHDVITDVAGALLVREEDIFVAAGPDVWRLRDRNGDGLPDEKTSISHGYAVHIGFSGHGMSGLIEGPDGKIYWGIGDIGAHIQSPDGKTHAYPNEGVIVRSNPDGSDFEVFAAGLRNTHEFVFDEYGNLITSDNDGDHPGESERLVHIVEGTDLGWRANWQYGKYTDPANNTYNVWMDEKLYIPRWEGQAAYILPPIMNYHNGPTGMIYNPGTALGSDWKNKYFLVEFVGNPGRSHIWSFGLKPKGATFELESEKDVLSGLLPTGIRFGPDGALYAADWINGWGTKNYGRVWKLDVTPEKNDLQAQRAETQRLMRLAYAKESEESLFNLLAYGDMRIRQKAQFELAKRGKKGWNTFKRALARPEQLARIHGIWGIGQLARKDAALAAPLLELLQDSDPEIVAQSLKVLGDLNYAAGERYQALLAHASLRVRFYAAQAIGRSAYGAAVPALLAMLEQNNDQDHYLRHAGIVALARIGQEAPLAALASHPSKALRTAAVVALRRMKSPKVADFLKDPDEYIVTEAARAINDDLSIVPALPALAAVLAETRFSAEPLLRRAINAALRVGGEQELGLLLAFAGRDGLSTPMRAEALAALGTWARPSVLDRVDGRYRGVIERDPAPVAARVREAAPQFLASQDPAVLSAAIRMLSALGIRDFNASVAAQLQHRDPAVRIAALEALQNLQYDQLEQAIRRSMADRDGSVRTAAIGLLDNLATTRSSLPGIVDPIFRQGSVQEQQMLLKALARMPLDQTEPVFGKLIDQLAAKRLPPGIILDLADAVDSTGSEALKGRLAPLRSSGTTAAAYAETLYGGDGRAGYGYVMYNASGQCIRCHMLWGEGGKVGPDLTRIGAVLSREQLLQALIEPSARLAPGYGTVTLTLADGQTVAGVLLEESASELLLQTSHAEPLRVPVSRIKTRTNLPSGMPAMGERMSKREIRDVIEFLAGRK